MRSSESAHWTGGDIRLGPKNPSTHRFLRFRRRVTERSRHRRWSRHRVFGRPVGRLRQTSKCQVERRFRIQMNLPPILQARTDTPRRPLRRLIRIRKRKPEGRPPRTTRRRPRVLRRLSKPHRAPFPTSTLRLPHTGNAAFRPRAIRIAIGNPPRGRRTNAILLGAGIRRTRPPRTSTGIHRTRRVQPLLRFRRLPGMVTTLRCRREITGHPARRPGRYFRPRLPSLCLPSFRPLLPSLCLRSLCLPRRRPGRAVKRRLLRRFARALRRPPPARRPNLSKGPRSLPGLVRK